MWLCYAVVLVLPSCGWLLSWRNKWEKTLLLWSPNSKDSWEDTRIWVCLSPQSIPQGLYWHSFLMGIKPEEWVAPIPGWPCLAGFYVMENSPRQWPVISDLTSTWLKISLLYMPTMLPAISGGMILFLRCVFNTLGFSTGGISFFFFLRRLSSEWVLCLLQAMVQVSGAASAGHCTMYRLLMAHMQQLVQVHTMVGELEEGLLFHLLFSHLGGW